MTIYNNFANNSIFTRYYSDIHGLKLNNMRGMYSISEQIWKYLALTDTKN